MWKPEESLDDYVVTHTSDITSEPPRPVSLQRTGEVEVLKPLTRLELRKRAARFAFRALHPYQPLWFRRVVVVGSAALVLIGLILVSAILVGINDRVAG